MQGQPHGGGGTGYKKEGSEWEDKLRQMKIGEYADMEAPEQEEKSWAVLEETEGRAKDKELSRATLDDLDELEDDEDEEVLNKYRAQRLAEMKMQAMASQRVSGGLPEISKSQWTDQVTDAAFKQKVVVLLYKPGEDWCALLERQLITVASRNPRVKFLKIVFTHAISNFPESSLPTLLVYDADKPIQQIIGLSVYGGGSNMTPDDVEWALHIRGVVKSEMEENPRTGAKDSNVRYDYVGGVMEDY